MDAGISQLAPNLPIAIPNYHIIIQQLLPLPFQKLHNKEVILVLIEVNAFFIELCSEVATPHDFDCLQHRIVIALCHLTRLFPPFLDIMIHLSIYLAYGAIIAGPKIIPENQWKNVGQFWASAPGQVSGTCCFLE